MSLTELGANWDQSGRVEIMPVDPLWPTPSKAALERIERLEQSAAEALARFRHFPLATISEGM